jgi:hypothetical protein
MVSNRLSTSAGPKGSRSDVGYVVAGWIIALTVFFLYAVSLLLRARRLAVQVPPDRQRWMTTDE